MADLCPTCGADLSDPRHYDEHRWSGCPALASTDDEDRLAEAARLLEEAMSHVTSDDLRTRYQEWLDRG